MSNNNISMNTHVYNYIHATNMHTSTVSMNAYATDMHHSTANMHTNIISATSESKNMGHNTWK